MTVRQTIELDGGSGGPLETDGPVRQIIETEGTAPVTGPGKVARLGDFSDHGGTIISASLNVTANSIGVARNGDLHQCPISGHGTTPLISSARTKANSRSIVRTGDFAGCGAMITTGSPNVTAS